MTHIPKAGKALVIYNPTAGNAADVDLCLGAIVDSLCKQKHFTVTVCATTPHTTNQKALQLIDDSYDLIVAAGGDGTIRLVLGAVSQITPATPVAIIPLGTGNQLARNLKIYAENLLTDPYIEAIKTMLNGRPRRIDLGTMNGEYFCVAVGAGPISDAVITPSRQDKASLKMFAYVSSVLQTLALPPVVFSIRTEQDQFTVTASGVFVTNVGDLGLGTLSDSADLNDGLLDLCILTPGEFEDYLQLGFSFVSGLTTEQPPYYIRKIKAADIAVLPVESQLSDFQSIAHMVRATLKGSPGQQPQVQDQHIAMIDGDACGQTPMHIAVLPHAVAVLTP